MEKFEFYNPVRVIWGPGELKLLGKKAAEYGDKVLVVTTKGLNKLPFFERIIDILKKAEMQVFILDEVDPNPRISTARKGAAICKEEEVDIVIAVGGGSAIDCAKTIAIAALDDGDPWDFFLLEREAKNALPIGVVSTNAATGSEMNTNAVLTNEDTEQKYSIHYEFIYPKFAIIDPELHVTVPATHTAYGAFDILSHIMESYFDGTPDTPLQDYLAEGVMKTTIEHAPQAVKNPDDVNARGILSWAATLALNGLNDAGRGGKMYDAHTIEHEVGAKYDIPHGAGLAIVQPFWLKHKARKNPEKFVQFAERVFSIKKQGKTDIEIALEGIETLRQWAKSIGNPITLKEVGVEKDMLKKIAEDTVKNPEGKDLDKNEVYEVLVESYE